MTEELLKIDNSAPATPAAEEIAKIMGRIQVKRAAMVAAPPADISAEINETLKEKGYPKRHRLRLREGLVGPGAEKAAELLPRVLAGDCLILLVGARGPGKTQMATWWASERIKAGEKPGFYRKTADLITEIKTTWADGGKSVDTENDVLKKYRGAAYLVLDEFHEKGSSDWESRTLINILDHRYDSMLATVIIANMDEAQVREQINPSIVSRAEETGGLVVCDWPSYRSQV